MIKTEARKIVKTYYRDVLDPTIEDGHGQLEYNDVVARGVEKILGDSSFLHHSQDDQVLLRLNPACPND